MHIQYNEACTQIKAPAMYIHSYGRDNELLFCQWFQQAFYLILQAAAMSSYQKYFISR
jgi:hypothetical protein